MEEDTQEVLTVLRGALGEAAAAAIPNADRASEYQHLLGIDKKLAWRLHKFLNEPDIMAASLHLPSLGGVKIILKALADAGATPENVTVAREAFERFQQVVRSHAGERSSMNMMIASASQTALTEAARAHQASAYKANSFIWGVQAKLQLSTMILRPSDETPDRVDIATLRGLHELRRIRSNVPWVIGRTRCVDDDGQIRYPLNLRPLDPLDPLTTGDSGLPPVPLMREFCSDPLPEVRRVLGIDGHLEDELVEGPVGNKGVVDCFTGELAQGAGVIYADEHNKMADLAIRVRTPLRWLFVDLHIHRDIAPAQTPSLGAYSDLAVMNRTPRRVERDRLLLSSEIQVMGNEPGSAYLPQFKKFPAMLGYTFDRLGWDPKEFVHYRVLIEYPVTPSSVHIGWPLPERK